MALILTYLQFFFLFQSILFVDGFLFSKKSKKSDNKFHLTAAKNDPEMPKAIRKILYDFGDHPIRRIELGRTPVLAIIQKFLNFMSSNDFKKKQMELGYDDIYHNYLLITIELDSDDKINNNFVANGNSKTSEHIFKLEKAHVVRLIDPVFPTEFEDTYDIPLPSDKKYTLNRLITTASNIDKGFYTYDAANNNMCQTFVDNIIDINGLSDYIVDPTTRAALKPQDAKALVATLGSRSDIVKTITDLGGTFDRLFKERHLKWKKPVKKEFAVLGDLHVNVVNKTDVHEVVPKKKNGVVVVDGDVETHFENTDQIYDAVVALEAQEQNNQTKLVILIIILTIIVIVAIVISFYFYYRKRKNANGQRDENKKDLEKNKSQSNISDTSSLNSEASEADQPPM